MAAAVAAALAMAAVLGFAAVRPAGAEPLLFAPDLPLPAPSPAPPVAVPTLVAPSSPKTGTLDCWLLAPDRLERAADQGVCADAFAATPEIAALPAPSPPPGPAAMPARKPKPPVRRLHASSRSESHFTRSSAARAGGGGEFDFFANFRRDFHALTELLSSGEAPQGDGRGTGPGSHMSHGH